MRAILALAIAAATIAATPAPAAAEDRWYGWQTGLADLTAVAVIADAVAEPDHDKQNQVWAGLAIYVGAAPLIHWANGEAHQARTSLVCRAAIPPVTGLAVALIAAGTSHCEGEFCGLGAILYGMAGFAAAALIVAAVDSVTAVAEEEEEVAPAMLGYSGAF